MSKRIIKCPICKSIDLKLSNYKENQYQDRWSFDCFIKKTLSTCKDCKLTFTSETFEKGSLSKFYKILYKDQPILRFSSIENYEFTRRFLSHVLFIKSSILLRDNMNILEIGPNQIGMLSTFKLFCTPNYFYYEQLEFPIIKYFGGKRLGNYFSREAATGLEQKKKMDLIVLSHCLEHFEPEKLNSDIRTMNYALKNNGYISIEVPLEKPHEINPPHTLSFNVKNMIRLFENHGFKIISTQSIRPKDWEPANDKNQEKPSDQLLSFRLLKIIMGYIVPRKLRIKLSRTFFEKKLNPMYDGLPYMRLIAQKQ